MSTDTARAGAARGHGVDDREGLEEGVDEVDHDQEEGLKVERRSASSIGCGGPPNDVVDPNELLIAL